ncbi:MAG TPA: HAMP domain-containing sensor histidine kinase [Jatrophihabitans sp.]|nr:HAMP domain-containing sensor histidine kinase [Jatrophihabitans sp.]
MSIAGRIWGAARRVHARTPLRLRLVAALMLLVVAALLGSGIAATTIMRSYLVGRVDDQLAEVGDYPIEGVIAGGQTDPDGSGPGGNGPGGHGADGHGARSRLPSAFVVEVTDATGKIVYGPGGEQVNVQDPLPRLPHLSAAQSQAAGAQLATVPAVSGTESWRLLIKPVLLTDGSSGTLFVAQSLGDVGGTIQRMTMLLLIIGAVAVALLAGVCYLVVRVSLRPLRDVERTAAAIAGGDLAQRVPHADSRTEVGQLSGALNTMLVEIETAFAQRAASEQAARRSEEHARQSEERMRRFVADASHELRTPLTSIRGFAELYRQGAVSDRAEVTTLMQRIEDEAQRMGLLVADLLLLARLDQQRPLEQVPVDMLAVAGDAVTAARAAAPDRPITLDVGSTDPPPVVLGDDARLRQVLANLLSNAVRHTPAGTPVSVRLETRLTQGRAALVLTVADNGPGMTAEEAARIFERFYRADPSRRRDAGGTGLGLAIVAAIVAGHGGWVSVQSAPGRGARFWVELPLAEVGAPLPG